MRLDQNIDYEKYKNCHLIVKNNNIKMYTTNAQEDKDGSIFVKRWCISMFKTWHNNIFWI